MTNLVSSATARVRVPGVAITAVAVVAVLFFFSGLVQYAFSTKLVSAPPTYFILPFLGTAAAVAMLRKPVQDSMGLALLIWAGIYIVISTVGVFIATDPERAGDLLRHRLLAVGFLFAMRALCGSAAGFTWSLRAVALVEIVSIGLNVYEWFSPMSFSLVYGRGAGLYQNPNISGGAIVLGMLIGLAAVPRKLREAFILAALGGVLLTVSRGALIGFVLALGCLVYFGRSVSRSRLAVAALVAVVAAAGLQDWFTGGLDNVLSSQPELFRRLTIDGSVGEENTESRLTLAANGLTHFLAHPVAGAGLGATDWVAGAGTHNIYAMHLAEHGVFGLLFVPGLLLLLGLRAWSLRCEPVLVAAVVFIASWGFFSHNVLDEFHHLLIFALLLAPHSVVAQAWGSAAEPVRLRRYMRTARVLMTPSVGRTEGAA
jgi:hypothetical protein